jgi:hypothetical protein
MPSKKYKFFNKRATKLSSPELTMVKPNNQSASKEDKSYFGKIDGASQPPQIRF